MLSQICKTVHKSMSEIITPLSLRTAHPGPDCGHYRGSTVIQREISEMIQRIMQINYTLLPSPTLH